MKSYIFLGVPRDPARKRLDRGGLSALAVLIPLALH